MFTPRAYGSSQARACIQAAAVTYIAIAEPPDPFNLLLLGRGSNPHLCSKPSASSWSLNPLNQSGNPSFLIFLNFGPSWTFYLLNYTQKNFPCFQKIMYEKEKRVTLQQRTLRDATSTKRSRSTSPMISLAAVMDPWCEEKGTSSLWSSSPKPTDSV